MIQKTISLSEEAYNALREAKGDGDSFSEFIIKTFSQKRSDILSFAGSLKNEDEWDAIQEEIYKRRENRSERDISFDE